MNSICNRFGFTISQKMLCSIAELRGLESCRITGGQFPDTAGLNLEVRECQSIVHSCWNLAISTIAGYTCLNPHRGQGRSLSP